MCVSRKYILVHAYHYSTINILSYVYICCHVNIHLYFYIMENRWVPCNNPIRSNSVVIHTWSMHRWPLGRKGSANLQSNIVRLARTPAVIKHGLRDRRRDLQHKWCVFGMDECHYSDVIIGTMASQISSLVIVYSAVYSGTDQRKYQSSASRAFARGPVNSPHKGSVTRKNFHLMT